MSGERLDAIAFEMLQSTNVFDAEITALKYTNRQGEVVSLLDLVKERISQHNHRFRGKSERNLKLVCDSIAGAMVTYLEGYPVAFSFKQRTRKKFKGWLQAISKKYNIVNAEIPPELEISKGDIDTGVAMLKLLHSRDGVSHEVLQAELNITERAVQKDLIKLSPSLYSGPSSSKEPYVPFRLGGQPLSAEISVLLPDSRKGSKRFFSRNSVHPLVLQENIMQLATLLKSLCHQYYGYEDDMAPVIAIDIWSQMSEYAQKKIINYYAFDDSELASFIEILKDECPDDHVCAYRTERAMLDEIELPIDQALPALMKVDGRTGVVVLHTGERITVQHLRPIDKQNGTKAYEAITPDGKTYIFTKREVEHIHIN